MVCIVSTSLADDYFFVLCVLCSQSDGRLDEHTERHIVPKPNSSGGYDLLRKHPVVEIGQSLAAPPCTEEDIGVVCVLVYERRCPL